MFDDSPRNDTNNWNDLQIYPGINAKWFICFYIQ